MTALANRDTKIIPLLLEQSTAENLNYQAIGFPHYSIFQFIKELSDNATLNFLPLLQKKKVDFNKTISCSMLHADFLRPSGASVTDYQLSASNMSLLHFYIENMTQYPGSKINLQLIEQLVLLGVDPQVKAVFTLTKKLPQGPQIIKRVELTASEYATEVLDSLLPRQCSTAIISAIKKHKTDADFLRALPDEDEESLPRIQNLFHLFTNLQRVLCGEKALAYEGLPRVEHRPILPQQISEPILDLAQITANLTAARAENNQVNWQAQQELLINYVKSAPCADSFLQRINEVKHLLQLHFHVSIDKTTNKVRYGSTMYRIFHSFDPYQLPSSWEVLRNLGQEKYDIDINQLCTVNRL